ncbi:STN domain-containing protein [Methylotenera sp.]|uniref:STN domain-containing protein n=1 Tax=Methylotenera sp. TaxID=2051956 RepID=UPI0025EBB830|nr:STN domain-containing protein [Methylotenera sp.]
MKHNKKHNSKSTIAASIFASWALLAWQPNAVAAELNTQLPQEQDSISFAPLQISLPSQQLSTSLKKLGDMAGLNIAYSNELLLGKTALAIQGKMSAKEAFQRLLSNSGLEVKVEGTTAYIKKSVEKISNTNEFKLNKIQVRAKRFHEIGPLRG